MSNVLSIGAKVILVFVGCFSSLVVIAAAVLAIADQRFGLPLETLADMAGMTATQFVRVIVAVAFVTATGVAWETRPWRAQDDAATTLDRRKEAASSLWNRLCAFLTNAWEAILAAGALLLFATMSGGLAYFAIKFWMIGSNVGRIVGGVLGFFAALFIGGVLLKELGGEWKKFGYIAIALSIALLFAAIAVAIWGGALIAWMLLLSLVMLVAFSNAFSGATPQLSEPDPPYHGRERTAEDVLKDQNLKF